MSREKAQGEAKILAGRNWKQPVRSKQEAQEWNAFRRQILANLAPGLGLTVDQLLRALGEA